MARRSLALVFLLCLIGAACSTSNDSNDDGGASGSGSASGEPIIIGFPADLTTDWAYYDSPMQEGAQFAVDQINASGGVLGRPLELTGRTYRRRPASSTCATTWPRERRSRSS